MSNIAAMPLTFRLELRTDSEPEASRVLTTWSPSAVPAAHQIGLTLAEAKRLLAQVQEALVQSQLAAHSDRCRPCECCHKPRAVKDYRSRQLRTLFGTINLRLPRFRACPCRRLAPEAPVSATVCPWTDLLPRGTAPELARLQAELGAKTSFREAARLLERLLPTAASSHASVRNHLWATAEQVERPAPAIPLAPPPPEPLDAAGGLAAPPKSSSDSSPSPLAHVVALDSAHVGASAGSPTRHWEVITGRVNVDGQPPRRFGTVMAGAERPLEPIRQALTDQGWRPGQPLTVLSDGDPVLPTLVRAAADQASVEHVLDTVSPLHAGASR